MLTARHISIIFLMLLNTLPAVSAQEGTTDFSHQTFNTVLNQYVESGAVDYPSINKDKNYHNYIESLKAEHKFDSRTEKLSYLINAYNALAIKGILDGRSPDSFFGKIGYFYNAKYQVYGRTTNLYDFEHDVILKLGEPRVHFALNCASTSCPNLNNTVFRAKTLNNQLETAATEFINDRTRNRYDLETKTAYLSKIFDWFEEEFKHHSGSVQQFLALYVTDNKISSALAKNEFNIQYLEYDWSLNGIPPGVTYRQLSNNFYEHRR
jgi:hypothetical protein